MDTHGSQRGLNALAREVFFAGLEVHKALGPGMLEKAYETCLEYELDLRGLACERQVSLPVSYKQLLVQDAYKIDLLVEGKLVLELKTVERLLDKHKAQLLTYLRYGDFRLGLLINFNTALFKNGVVRIANGV